MSCINSELNKLSSQWYPTHSIYLLIYLVAGVWQVVGDKVFDGTELSVGPSGGRSYQQRVSIAVLVFEVLCAAEAPKTTVNHHCQTGA